MSVPNLDLERVISDLITGELARRRRIPAVEAARAAFSQEMDAAEWLVMAQAVVEMFHLRGTGAEEDLLAHRTIQTWSHIVGWSGERQIGEITFRTSGSTGTPTRCTHPWNNLKEEAAEHALDLPGCRRILSMVPSNHIFGFIFTVLLPRALQAQVVDVRRWDAARIGAELKSGDLLIGVPQSWRMLLSSLDVTPAGVAGVTSGAPCPIELFASLSAAGVRIRDVYGSSETAGIGVKLAPARAFELMRFWRVDEQHKLSRGAGEWMQVADVPDTLYWETARRFQVGRRQDGAVQIFGTNVYPARVARVMRDCPAVEDCAVRLMSSHEGDRLKAFVVWREGAGEVSEDLLKRWLAKRLESREQPGSFTFGAKLPVDEMNKAQDWGIRIEA